MFGYYADSLLVIDRLQGKTVVQTVNNDLQLDMLDDNLLISGDSYLYIVEARRTGSRKMRILLKMEDGDLVEA